MYSIIVHLMPYSSIELQVILGYWIELDWKGLAVVFQLEDVLWPRPRIEDIVT